MSPYEFGIKSEGIRILQQHLADHGFNPGPVDGIYGGSTLKAINDARGVYKIDTPGVSVRLLIELGVISPKPKPLSPPKASNSISDFLAGIAIKAAINKLKGLPIMNVLGGYKTYIIGAFLIGAGVLELFGVIIPGMTGDPTTLITTGVGLIFGRLGAANDVKKALGQP